MWPRGLFSNFEPSFETLLTSRQAHHLDHSMGGGSFLDVFAFRATGGERARQEATARKDKKDDKEGREEGRKELRRQGRKEEGTALLFTVALETLAGTVSSAKP